MQKLYFLLLLAVFAVGSLFSQTDTAEVTRMKMHAWSLKDIYPDSSVMICKKALHILKTLPQSQPLTPFWKEKSTVKIYYCLSFFYSNTGKISTCLSYVDTLMKLSNDIGYDWGRARAYDVLGKVYMSMSDFPKALEYYFQALKLFEKMGETRSVITISSHIGHVYRYQNNYEKAAEYVHKAMRQALSFGDKTIISAQYINLAILYHHQGNDEKSVEAFLKGLEISKELDNKTEISLILGNLGEVYRTMGLYDKALDHLNRALVLAKELGIRDYESVFNGQIGLVYIRTKHYDKAEAYLLKALAIARELRIVDDIKSFEEELSNMYALLGRHKEALEHYKKHVEARDSIYNAGNTEKTVRSEMSYEFDKKQALRQAQHEKEIIALEAEGKIQKQLQIFFVVVIVLTLVILFFMKRAYDNKKRVASFLESETERKEVLLQEVHHRINNNLQIISSLLSLQAGSVQDERLNEFLKQSQNRIQSLSVMHELLYQTDSMLEIDMQEYLEKILSFHRDVISTRSSNIEIDLKVADAKFPAKTAVPLALIVNELITNSMKYAFDAMSQGKIDVSLLPDKTTDKGWVLLVKDNGKGLPEESGQRKNGLGLRLVNIMVKQMNALFSKSSGPGASFTVSFSLKA